MIDTIQINVKFIKSNPEHMQALRIIKSKGRKIGFNYATYISEAVLAYEKLDQMEEYKKMLQEVLKEYEIRKREKVIPKM